MPLDQESGPPIIVETPAPNNVGGAAVRDVPTPSVTNDTTATVTRLPAQAQGGPIPVMITPPAPKYPRMDDDYNYYNNYHHNYNNFRGGRGRGWGRGGSWGRGGRGSWW